MLLCDHTNYIYVFKGDLRYWVGFRGDYKWVDYGLKWDYTKQKVRVIGSSTLCEWSTE
jgi:hypothetical protein